MEKAQANDYEEITEVWEASVRATHHFLSEKDILFYKLLIFNEYFHQVDLFFIKNDIDNIIAFMGLSGEKIEMLFVHPSQIGKGLGKYFISYAIKTLNVNSVDVNEQNKQAVLFYKHLGFETIERAPLDSMGKPFPILKMRINNIH